MVTIIKFLRVKFSPSYLVATLVVSDQKENHYNQSYFSLTRQLIQNAAVFLKKSPERIMPHTLVSHTNAHTIRGRPTVKDVERFRNRLVHEFYNLETLKTLKNVNTSDIEKITDLDEQNLDVERNNNKQNTTLDKEKDIQRNNLNYEYLSLTLVINIVTVCLFVLIVINTCKRLDIASFITAIVVLSFYLPMSRKFR